MTKKMASTSTTTTETKARTSVPERKKRPAKPLKISANRKKPKQSNVNENAITSVEEEALVPTTRKSTRKLPTTAAVVARDNAGIDDELVDADAPRLSKFCSKFRAKPPPSDTSTKKKNNSFKVSDHEKTETTGRDNGGSSGPVVQIIDGEIVLQESSMVLHGDAKPPTEEDEDYQVVEEEDQLGGIGSSYTSFSKAGRRPQHWSVDETRIFYEALRQVGTDFYSMEAFFTSTTKRKHKTLKHKFKKECVNNPKLIEAALNPSSRKNISMSLLLAFVQL